MSVGSPFLSKGAILAYLATGLIAAILLYVGITKALATSVLLAKAIKVDGTVTELVPVRDRDGTTYKVRYEFTDEAGATHTHLSSWSSSPPSYDKGEAIPIQYDPDDPAVHEVGGFWSIWIVEIILLSIGGLLLLMLGGLVVAGAFGQLPTSLGHQHATGEPDAIDDWMEEERREDDGFAINIGDDANDDFD